MCPWMPTCGGAPLDEHEEGDAPDGWARQAGGALPEDNHKWLNWPHPGRGRDSKGD